MATGDDPERPTAEDPDRAAILARRRRFVALALSGLASSGCKGPAAEPCLSVVAPEDLEGEGAGPDEGEESAEPSGLDGPIVEDPGAPLAGETGEDGEGGETSEDSGEPVTEAPPQPCLNVVAPKPPPRPCLKKRPPPKPCLMMID